MDWNNINSVDNDNEWNNDKRDREATAIPCLLAIFFFITGVMPWLMLWLGTK